MDILKGKSFGNYRNPILRVLLVLIAANFLVQSNQWYANVNKIPSGMKGHAVVFNEEMDSGMRISFVDTTDEHIYFAYSTIGVVAIYSKSGTYLCSYSFFSNTNGGLQMRCHEGILYVNDHANYEFVFNGTELNEVRQPSETEYTYGWYIENRTLDIVVDNGRIYDVFGNYIMEVPGRFF
jgi:hypothetical protein